MRYRFAARVIVEPVRLQRLDSEKRSEDSFSFRHHINQLREMDDEMTILAEVESPKGMDEKQKRAFERAMNRMLRHFRCYVFEEFDAITVNDAQQNDDVR